jgi:hypothetical protein
VPASRFRQQVGSAADGHRRACFRTGKILERECMMKKLNFDYLDEISKQQWWKNLVADSDIYIDLRKDSSVNVYYRGGSFLKLKAKSKKIHFSYLPVATKENEDYVEITEENGKLSFDAKQIDVKFDDLDKKVIAAIKNNINKYYSETSEKGIQGAYASHWKKSEPKETEGFFIDTEYMYKESRIDLIYLHCKKQENPKLYFVELKTIDDPRLLASNKKEETLEVVKTDETKKQPENIGEQLKKYFNLITDRKDDFLVYYKEIFNWKSKLGLIPDQFKKIKIENLEIETKPILLIGNATAYWIKDYENIKNPLLPQIEKFSYRRIYRGSGSNYLNFTKSRNIYPKKQ